MPVNAFVSGGVTVQFNTPPDRPGGESTQLFQVDGFDSLGQQYIYDKSNLVRTAQAVVYPRITDAILTALRSFITDTVRGSKVKFTWYDHNGTAHTARFKTPDIAAQQIGPDRHRIELALEIDAVVNFPAVVDFDTAKNARTGSVPVWILRLTINAVDYFFSDCAFTIPATNIIADVGWPAGVVVNTQPLIGRWGRVRGEITGFLNEYKVSDFDVDIINDPDVAPNIKYLVQTYEIEESPAELYLWFLGLDAAYQPPRLKMRGYIEDITDVSDANVGLIIKDETARLQNYVGTKTSVIEFPSCDPDDVGKVIPIPFGTVSKYPGLAVDAGIATSLPSNISAAATSVIFSDAYGLAGKIVQIDDEKMLVQAIAGDTATVVRGYDGTLAAQHLKGAMVCEVKSEFVYLFSDIPLTSIGKIRGRIGQAEVDITAIATKYTGQPGNEHPDHPGRAVVSVPGFITVAQAVALAINDGVQITDDIAVLENIQMTDNISVADTINFTDAGHQHLESYVALDVGKPNVTSANFIDISKAFDHDGTTSASSYLNSTAWIQFDVAGATLGAELGKPLRYRWFVTRGVTGTVIESGSVSGAWNDIAPANQNWAWVKNAANCYHKLATTGGTNSQIFVIEARLDVEIDPSTSAAASILSKGGGAGRTAPNTNLPKTGGGGRTAPMDNMPKTGSVSLTGNSVANTLIGDQVLADLVSPLTIPAEVAQFLLTNYTPITVFQQVGAFPAFYKLNGVIDRYEPAQYWLDYFAFQCRAFFRLSCGIAKLIYRPDALTIVKNIPACLVIDDEKTLRQKKAPKSVILNKINLLFDRDWRRSRDDKAYKGNSKESRPESIRVHGEKEEPSLFMFDFITDQVMADHVRAFFIATYSKRPWISKFEAFLDHSELDFTDGITMAFSADAKAMVNAMEFAPGSSNQIDIINISAIGEIIYDPDYVRDGYVDDGYVAP